MKISELIAELEGAKMVMGDVEVGCQDAMSPGWYHPVTRTHNLIGKPLWLKSSDTMVAATHIPGKFSPEVTDKMMRSRTITWVGI